MIVSFLNQKGGVGKSSLARALAVEFVENGWATHVADLDRSQQTFFNWAERRKQTNKTEVEVALYSSPKSALKASQNCDVLIVDGKAFADTHALEIALKSDLVIIPVGVSVDDLEPSLKMAVELVNKGVDRSSLVFVVCKVPESGEKEAMQTRASIKSWNFDVVTGWVLYKSSYSKAMDKGLSLTEVQFASLQSKADNIIQQFFNFIVEKNNG